MPRWILVFVASLLCSCTEVAKRTTSYTGVIERVESADYTGYIVSPRTPPAPVYRLTIYVRIIDPAVDNVKKVRIEISDTKPAGRYGKIGDNVTFTWFEHLPLDGHIPFDSLGHYTVRPN